MPTATERIDAVFRLVDREIWIVTAATAEGAGGPGAGGPDAGGPDAGGPGASGLRRGGLAATWVSQASIDAQRPLALIGLAPNHFTCELVDASGAFALHLLAAGQAELALSFATGSGRDRDKFEGLAVRAGATGSPLIQPCLAWLECKVFARLPTGDRVYYWADVVDGEGPADSAAGDQRPLTERQLMQQITGAQRERLKAGRDSDISVQRPLVDAWRRELPDLIRWS